MIATNDMRVVLKTSIQKFSMITVCGHQDKFAKGVSDVQRVGFPAISGELGQVWTICGHGEHHGEFKGTPDKVKNRSWWAPGPTGQAS